MVVLEEVQISTSERVEGRNEKITVFWAKHAQVIFIIEYGNYTLAIPSCVLYREPVSVGCKRLKFEMVKSAFDHYEREVSWKRFA